MSLISPMRTLTIGYAYIEVFFPHPRSRSRFFFFFFFFFFFCPKFEFFQRVFRGFKHLFPPPLPPTNHSSFFKLLFGLSGKKGFLPPFFFGPLALETTQPQ